MTDDQIKHMVQRFLQWKLPANFSPDAGISFKAEYGENGPYPGKHEPVGTNLFDATQAEAMVRHMIEGVPSSAREADLIRVLEYCLSSLQVLAAEEVKRNGGSGDAQMTARWAVWSHPGQSVAEAEAVLARIKQGAAA